MRLGAGYPDGGNYALYLLSNPIQAPMVGTDAHQAVAWEWVGSLSPFDNQQPIIPSAAQSSYGDTILANVMALRYPGQIYDQPSGLHYNWHRYYDPTTGRYLQADPIGLAGGINPYAYVSGNPLREIDTTGLESPTVSLMGLPKQPDPFSQIYNSNFNQSPCVKKYLTDHYGPLVANTLVPNFSALSYIPGSGNARSVDEEGVVIGGAKLGIVEKLGKASNALMKWGVSSGTLEGAGGYLLGLMGTGLTATAYAGAGMITASTLPFSTAANITALAFSSCNCQTR